MQRWFKGPLGSRHIWLSKFFPYLNVLFCVLYFSCLSKNTYMCRQFCKPFKNDVIYLDKNIFKHILLYYNFTSNKYYHVYYNNIAVVLWLVTFKVDIVWYIIYYCPNYVEQAFFMVAYGPTITRTNILDFENYIFCILFFFLVSDMHIILW